MVNKEQEKDLYTFDMKGRASEDGGFAFTMNIPEADASVHTQFEVNKETGASHGTVSSDTMDFELNMHLEDNGAISYQMFLNNKEENKEVLVNCLLETDVVKGKMIQLCRHDATNELMLVGQADLKENKMFMVNKNSDEGYLFAVIDLFAPTEVNPIEVSELQIVFLTFDDRLPREPIAEFIGGGTFM